MMSTITDKVPRYPDLIAPCFSALRKLGGSGTNQEILELVISDLQLPDEVADAVHGSNRGITELAYQLNWAKTYLKKSGHIENPSRGVWSITPDHANSSSVDPKEVMKAALGSFGGEGNTGDAPGEPPEGTRQPEPEWRIRLTEILQTMNPYGFEVFCTRLLRECGFTDVKVTRKSGDGGIDGYGRLSINGIFSYNVAFQCKRFSNSVSAPLIRDFRGSLPANIEKGILITTGTFTQEAIREASSESKQQIDLMDGQALMDKIVEYGIGVKPVTTYEIDEDFFAQYSPSKPNTPVPPEEDGGTRYETPAAQENPIRAAEPQPEQTA